MIRTDLAMEAHKLSTADGTRIDGVKVSEEEYEGIKITRVEVMDENGSKAIGKAVGKYITVDAPNLRYDNNVYKRTCAIVGDEIRKLANIDENTLTLAAGLGNDDITPDALGTEAVSKLIITHHLKKYMENEMTKNLSCVCAITPGVMGSTGMETVEIIRAVCDSLKPDIVIAIDALAAAECERLGSTIQISDAGIQPGAGVGNNRRGLNSDTLNAKVIAMGIPTVIDASAMLGEERENDPLMVTPKDIDKIIEYGAKTIANGINLALHKNLTFEEIESLAG